MRVKVWFLCLVFSLLFLLAGCFTKQDAPVFTGDIVVEGTVKEFHQDPDSILLEERPVGINSEILLIEQSKIYSSNGCLMDKNTKIAAGSTVKILGFFSDPYLVADTIWLLDVEIFDTHCSASELGE